MKKFFWLMIATVLTCCLLLVPGMAEEEDNIGEIIIVDDWSELIEDPEAIETEDEEIEPFIPEDAEKAIIGRDDRKVIYNTSVYPYSAIAYMTVQGRCGCSWTASGFMVGKRKLLTGAHCLVCPTHSSWANRATFYFGYKNTRNYKYCYNGAWTAWVGNTFSSGSYSINNDWGVVRFNQDVGNYTGWFGYRCNVSSATLNKNTYYVTGYRGGILRSGSGRGVKRSGNFLLFTIDTQPGNSGCPVYDKGYYAVGICIAESSKQNYAFVINNAIARIN